VPRVFSAKLLILGHTPSLATLSHVGAHMLPAKLAKPSPYTSSLGMSLEDQDVGYMLDRLLARSLDRPAHAVDYSFGWVTRFAWYDGKCSSTSRIRPLFLGRDLTVVLVSSRQQMTPAGPFLLSVEFILGGSSVSGTTRDKPSTHVKSSGYANQVVRPHGFHPKTKIGQACARMENLYCVREKCLDTHVGYA
jgi:hypothetical protein